MSPWAWQDHAACRGKDLNLFFGGEHEQYDQESKRQREARARAMCGDCPVRGACREYALERPERYGLWGGLDEDERARARRNATRRLHDARRAERVA